jgi:hypothetical protein
MGHLGQPETVPASSRGPATHLSAFTFYLKEVDSLNTESISRRGNDDESFDMVNGIQIGQHQVGDEPRIRVDEVKGKGV